MNMQYWRRCCLNCLPIPLLGFCGTLLFASAANISDHRHLIAGIFAIAFFSLFSLGIGSIKTLRGFQFTAWVVTAVVAAICFPNAFKVWSISGIFRIELRNKYLMLIIIQLVMFGMGTQMSLSEFRGILKMPRAVLVGSFCQFTIMPIIGYTLTRVFSFPPEISAGIVLIGSCASGLASNVLTYLAGGNLPLSVTLTAMSTMISPIMTPLWMKLLARQYVHVDFMVMMTEALKIVVIPVAAALLNDYLRHASGATRRRFGIAAVLIAVCLILLTLGLLNRINLLFSTLPESAGVRVGVVFLSQMILFCAISVLAAVVYNRLSTKYTSLDRRMPLFSMFGICYFTLVTTAAGRNNLLSIGPALFLAAVIHNTLGYLFGYWLSRLMGMDVASARTVAFEVGLHNAGMASGLAASMEKLATVGLPATIFSPWMNISGSILANYWHRKSARESQLETQKLRER